jgi:hypothetical protein
LFEVETGMPWQTKATVPRISVLIHLQDPSLGKSLLDLKSEYGSRTLAADIPFTLVKAF